MIFPVSVSTKKPEWNSLPMGKLSCFPLGTPIGDQIYGETQVAFEKGKGLYVRIWSFETEPGPDCSLEFACLFAKSEHWVSFTPGGKKKADFKIMPELSLFSGEDLQGIYWGGELFFSKEVLRTLMPEWDGKESFSFMGNIYNRSRATGALFAEEWGGFELLRPL